ncbi:helix-turn-helix transcriptional regulator [Pseudarthrobacter cellobiosi]|uniref:helix-turn-helix transcriptional regulator n=1 Tax=Pseudarthrobacter cellobiosi TaxID=2953654 RepID=UPI00208EB47B|nr:helix-turn-helix transcriptional regulator [Pseudarthrobacter sp. HLT1-5]MCO4256477.1 helix-turn-helix transcriptional regulator [Pseudarthrobacter sp. HLT1-5]
MSETNSIFVSDPNDLKQMIASELINQSQDMMDELLQLRKRKGMTQQDIADIIGITRTAVTAFERYDSDPKLSTLVRYAMAVGARLNITVEDGETWAKVEREREYIAEFVGGAEPSHADSAVASFLTESVK